jgi:hypothetical protein
MLSFGPSMTVPRWSRFAGQPANADTAVALIGERKMILRDLRAMGAAHIEATLDRLGSEARPTSELWSAHSAYLHHLPYGDELERNSKLPLRSPRVALPIRLLVNVVDLTDPKILGLAGLKATVPADLIHEASIAFAITVLPRRHSRRR